MGRSRTIERYTQHVAVITNFIFLGLGIVVLIIGVIGNSKANDLHNNGGLLDSFQIDVLSTAIFSCGIATICISIIGFLGAKFKIPNFLKFYAFVMVLIVGLQIAMGAYMYQINAGDVQSTWAASGPVAYQNRVVFQNWKGCCGWNKWFDAIGSLNTECYNKPINPSASPPQTCQSAVKDFIDAWVRPVAAGAISIAVIEIALMMFSCFMLFKGKDHVPWAESEFHY